MRVIACLSGSDPVYVELARVLRVSIQCNFPGASFELRRMQERTLDRFPAFVQKARDWYRVVRDSMNGTKLALLDVDTLVLGPLDEAFSQPFTIAVTERPFREPINSGVLFIRVSDEARALMLSWLRMTKRMVYTTLNRARRYSDQDALVRIVNGAPNGMVARLPCHIWNCEQTTWHLFDRQETRIVHIKSDVREHLFHSGALRNPAGQPIVDLFRYYQSLTVEDLL